MNEEVPAETGEGAKGIRWWPAILSIGVLGCAEAFIFWSLEGKEDRTLQGFSFLLFMVILSILLVSWWVLFSRTTWETRLRGIGVLILLGLLIRFDGFTGDIFPSFSFRWSPSPKEKAEKSRADLSDAELKPSAGIGDLKMRDYLLQSTDWPGYLGAGRDGIVHGHTYNETWLNPGEVWRIPMGDGWSSFAVAGPLCWTQEQDGDEERVTCYEVATGARLWRHADRIRFDETFGGPGPRATPTFHGGRIYSLGATGLLNCLDAGTGKPAWSVNILSDNGAVNLDWAMSGSPLVHDGRVIVSPGGKNGRSLVAYDLENGERLWSAGSGVASYSSPQYAVIHGVPQILILNGEGLASHAPDDGHVLWNHPWTNMNKVLVAQPLPCLDSSILLSAGYRKGSVLLDIAFKDGQWSVSERWKSLRLKAKFNNLILHGSHVYGLDEGILVCLDLTTGKRIWKGGRYGYGQMVRVGDVLVVLAESGEVVHVRATPDGHQEIGRFDALEGKTWNHPAIANGRLLVRNNQQAACFLLFD